MSGSSYRIFEESRPYFLTCTVWNWIPIFKDRDRLNVVLGSLSFLHESGRISLFAYVIMPNHVHLVASSKDLAKEIGNFKSFCARSIIDSLEQARSLELLRLFRLGRRETDKSRSYRVWTYGNHPQMIAGRAMMEQKIQYIHFNPVRKGFVDDPCDWPYSSARDYEGKKGLIDIDMDW